MMNSFFCSLAAVQTASKTLMDSLNEIYESQWTGHDLLYVQAQNLDMLWQDFTHKLADQVLVPLNTYQSQFPEMRVRLTIYTISIKTFISISVIFFVISYGKLGHSDSILVYSYKTEIIARYGRKKFIEILKYCTEIFE